MGVGGGLRGFEGEKVNRGEGGKVILDFGFRILDWGWGREGSLGGGDDAIEELGGGEDSGDAGAGMGAGPAQVEAFDILGDVVGAEPSALGENGLELERGADVGVEPGFKVGRGEENFADEMLAEVGDH